MGSALPPELPAGDSDGEALLPPAVEDVLGNISRAEERQRFYVFFSAAARAVDALGELDLSAFEIDDTGSMDLAVWELLAPHLKETLAAVNALLDTVRQQFPETDRDSPAAPGGEAEKVRQAIGMVQTIAQRLAHDVAAFGEKIRKPQLVADRWLLLDLVAQLRGKSRLAIGEMAFVAARVFANVQRQDVVPFYEDDVDISVQVRQGLTLLRRALRPLQAAMGQQTLTEVRHTAQAVLAELEGFTQIPAYKHLRAADKRALIEARQNLVAQSRDAGGGLQVLRAAMEGLVRFLDSLTVINRRELLVVHDRQIREQVVLHLTAACEAIYIGRRAVGEEAAREALDLCKRLLGRDPQLDNLIWVMARLPWAGLGVTELLAAVDTLSGQVGKLQL